MNKTEAFLEGKKKAQEPCSQKLQGADEVKRSDLVILILLFVPSGSCNMFAEKCLQYIFNIYLLNVFLNFRN